MKKFLLVVFIILFAANDFYAQDKKMDVKAQIRLRNQADDRDFNSDTDLATFSELRTRVGINLYPEAGYRGFIQIQDSRVFGTEPSTLASTANLDLHQAYIYVENVFGSPSLDVKAGRMEVVYGNQRLIGAVGWHNVGRSFDGGILKIKNEKINVDLFGFQVNERLNVGDSLDNLLFGAWGKITASKGHTIQPFLIYEVQKKTDNLDRFTLGVQVNGKMGGFFHETEFAYQFGTITAGTEQDIKALLAAVNVGYKFKGKSKPVLSAGVDYLSGDDNPADDEFKVFNTLYATNHKFYGFMDYFLNVPAHTLGLGLTDIHGKIGLSFTEKLSGGLNFHIFKSNEDYTMLDGSTSSSFGTEVDLTLIYKSSKSLSLQGGISIFSPGEIFEEVRGEDTSLWAYLMTVFNF